MPCLRKRIVSVHSGMPVQERMGGDLLMASSEIVIKLETRPCVVRGKKGTFHQWGIRDKRTYGIVEFDGGHVNLVSPDKIVFTDVISFEERMKMLREGLL